ncbi:MAG TPA: HEAT repeat domain-containing protein [Gemmataceae bacterium]|jgi:HEAT repeat protein
MKRFLGVVGIVLCATAARGADVGELIKQLQSGDNDARRAAAKALGEGGTESKAAVPALIKALKDRDTFVRRFSAQALGEIGPDAQSAVRPLTAAVDDSKKEVQSAAAAALGKLGPSGIESLIGILRDDSKDTAIRRQAITSLGDLGPAAHSAVPALTEVLKEKTAKGKKKKMDPENVRVDAANALGSVAKSSDTDAIETLSALTDKKAKTPRNLRQAANAALRKIRTNK